jgi:hypothetical protein
MEKRGGNIMKKTLSSISIGFILLVTFLFSYAQAESLHGPNGLTPSVVPQATNTLLNAATSTGIGSPVNLGYFATKHFFTVTWGGTTPTNTVITIYCSLDGTNYGTLYPAETVTSSGHIFGYVDSMCQYLKAGYTSRSGGDGTTSVTITSHSQQ